MPVMCVAGMCAAAQVDTESTSEWVALAKHLKQTGAKMYGAFWCSHCLDQKLMFGAEGAKEMPYVECFPTGFDRCGRRRLV
eukprot:937635-Pyramimonas_sp.AAC.2